MKPRAYYNENDDFAAAWLRNLISAGLIAGGDVDNRSIRDVHSIDLLGYNQCHFFAGIGAWSHALRLAGWDDSRPVWTGSCPCQPFSNAGKRKGVADDRHLWPVWLPLIAERRPSIVFGEQVASRDGRDWLATVRSDLETLGYEIGAADLCAAGAGAPHQRQRLYFVGNADDEGSQRRRIRRDGADEWPSRSPGVACGVEHAYSGRWPAGREAPARMGQRGSAVAAGWDDCDWLPCTDGKSRPVEPGTLPLAHGITGRVGRLRGYGNAIVPQVAASFVTAFMECRP